MIQLHVEAKIKDGKKEELLHNFRNHFLPAIREREGFRGVYLLNNFENNRAIKIVIWFDSEPSRKRWVASEEHQEVWPKMKKCLKNIKDKNYEVLAGQTVLEKNSL